MQLTVIIAVLMALLTGESLLDESTASVLVDLGHLAGFAALAFVLGSILILASLMNLSARFALRRLIQSGAPDRAALRLPAHIDLFMRIAILVTFALQLSFGGWSFLIVRHWRLDRFVLADEVALLTPFLVLLTLKWLCFYPLNRYIREYIVAGQLADGFSARPVWSRRQYLSFQIRHGLLIILIPLLLMLALKDIVNLAQLYFFPDLSPQDHLIALTLQAVVAGGAILVFLLSPLLLRRIWITRPLPLGPLRRRLEQFCRHIKLGYRDILLWDTYSAVANAAVMGLLRPIRYVLLSDNLIENMSDEQIEAVFAHEAGHVKHHHILFLVLFIFAVIAAATLLMDGFAALLFALPLSESFLYRYGEWFVSALGLLLMVGGFLLFGVVSRRFERQADLHAALAVDPPADPQQLGQHGAFIMGTTLQRIALLNGISIDARSWRHSSINSRMEFLRRLATQTGALPRFRRRVKLIKIAILAAVLVGLTLGAFTLIRNGV